MGFTEARHATMPVTELSAARFAEFGPQIRFQLGPGYWFNSMLADLKFSWVTWIFPWRARPALEPECSAALYVDRTCGNSSTWFTECQHGRPLIHVQLGLRRRAATGESRRLPDVRQSLHGADGPPSLEKLK